MCVHELYPGHGNLERNIGLEQNQLMGLTVAKVTYNCTLFHKIRFPANPNKYGFPKLDPHNLFVGFILKKSDFLMTDLIQMSLRIIRFPKSVSLQILSNYIRLRIRCRDTRFVGFCGKPDLMELAVVVTETG